MEFCPVRSIYASLGGKWSLLILSHLNFGTHRFSELLGAIPDISGRNFLEKMEIILQWSLLNRDKIEANRHRHDKKSMSQRDT